MFPTPQILSQLRQLSRELKIAHSGSDIHRLVSDFDGWMERAPTEDDGVTGYDHAQTVKEYYDLCTQFMVFGWSESLHFAPLSPRESVEESQARHQLLMIDKLDLREGMMVIDVGCGIGGPMRRVVQESGVRVVGVNNNNTQLDRAKSLNTDAGIDHMVDYLACSFMDMGVIADNTLDRGYAIESTCHAPDKAAAFAEIYRVLKPGALLWGQEMCMTDTFDPDDSQHQAIKQALMRGIALRDIATMGEVNRDLETAGFEVIEGRDRAVDDDRLTTPWYQPMENHQGTLRNALQRIPLGRRLMIALLRLTGTVGLFPKGSEEVIELLDRTAKAYVAGGRAGIFTPLYCFLARKPL